MTSHTWLTFEKSEDAGTTPGGLVFHRLPYFLKIPVRLKGMGGKSPNTWYGVPRMNIGVQSAQGVIEVKRIPRELRITHALIARETPVMIEDFDFSFLKEKEEYPLRLKVVGPARPTEEIMHLFIDTVRLLYGV